MTEEKLSKYLSYLLRHHPEEANLAMDEEGWVYVVDLIENTNGNFSVAKLNQIVNNDPKRRYSFNENHTKIRANQGHSIHVNPGLKKQIPPEVLYHGTAERFLASILDEGIESQTRQYVHLSKDYDTALNVGLRHGDAVVLKLDIAKMLADNIDFYISENDVWLVDYVDPKYIVLDSHINVIKKVGIEKYKKG